MLLLDQRYSSQFTTLCTSKGFNKSVFKKVIIMKNIFYQQKAKKPREKLH